MQSDGLANRLQTSYAAQLIAIFTVTLAKISVLQFARVLNPRQHTMRSRLIATVVICSWAGFAVLSLLFQCHFPQPWIYTAEKCSKGALIYVVTVLDIVTDVYLSAFFVPTIWNLQMDRAVRLEVSAFFLLRLL